MPGSKSKENAALFITAVLSPILTHLTWTSNYLVHGWFWSIHYLTKEHLATRFAIMESPTEATFRQLVPGDSKSFVDMFGLPTSALPILWDMLIKQSPSFIDEEAQPLHMLFALMKLRTDVPTTAIAMMFGKSEAVVSHHMWPFIKAIGHLGERMMIGQDNSLALASIGRTQFVSASTQYVYDIAVRIETGDIISVQGPVSLSNFLGRFVASSQEGQRTNILQARQEIIIGRIRQFSILQNVESLGCDLHAIAFRAVVALVQLRAENGAPFPNPNNM